MIKNDLTLTRCICAKLGLCLLASVSLSLNCYALEPHEPTQAPTKPLVLAIPKNTHQEGITVTLLNTKTIDSPPVIAAKDIETFTRISNNTEVNFEFSYLRAVYFGDTKALSTYIYFNAHFGGNGNIPDLKDNNKPLISENPNEIPNPPNVLNKEEYVPESEQYTVAGAFFKGDFNDPELIKNFTPSHRFNIPKSEEFVISTESGGTFLGIESKYTSRTLVLDFLDEKGLSIHKARVAIN